jgi:Xaa-Pro aminopeptidase
MNHMSDLAQPIRGFSDDEFATRCQNAQSFMIEQNIDAILLTCEPDIRYFTGYFTRFWESPTRPWFVLLPKAGKPIAIIPAIGADLMSKCWVDDIHTWISPDLVDDGVTLLSDIILKTIGKNGNLGIPMGHETHLRMPLASFFKLQHLTPNITIVDASHLLVSLQLVKSDAEIAKIAHICRIADRSFARIEEICAQGRTISSVFRNFQRLLLEEGADWVPYMAGGAEQGGYSDVISPASEALLQDGDIIMIDTGAVYDGYFCDFDRNFAIGSANQPAHDAYTLLYEATEAGINAAQIGRKASDIYQAIADVISAQKDIGDVGRLGHGLGMRLTEWPSLIATDHTVLKQNMVLTIEPSLEISSGKIMVHEENIVITKQGAQLLSKRASKHLPILGASS